MSKNPPTAPTILHVATSDEPVSGKKLVMIGHVSEFDVNNGNWTLYVRRLKQYFKVNDIPAAKEVPTLIAVVGDKAYEVMSDLCHPKAPEDQTFEALVKIVTAHLAPESSIIAERYSFRQRKQKEGECLKDYLQSLRHLAKTCEFGTTLEENLRDQFVSGLIDDRIRSRIFGEKTLDFHEAVKLGLAMEKAEIESHQIKGIEKIEVNRVKVVKMKDNKDKEKTLTQKKGSSNGFRPTSNLTCFVCGRSNHVKPQCRYKNYRCRTCGKIGHLQKMCKNPVNTNFMELNSDSESESDCLNNVNVSSMKNDFMIDVEVEGKNLKMLIDTGSAISAIPSTLYSSKFSNLKIFPSSLNLTTYTGSKVESLGFMDVKVSSVGVNKVNKNLRLFICKNGGVPLLGREWIKELNLGIEGIFAITDRPIGLDHLFNKFKDVFDGKLGKLKGFKFHFKLKENAKPVAHRARPVPVMLKKKVEDELERLVNSGILQKVDFSEWATPIVPVPKKSGEIRICGDYKVTINPYLDIEKYNLPKIEELLAKLDNGAEFSKLDLSQAYQQLEIAEEHRKYTTISTHMGLFSYSRVPYGLSPIPEKFQLIMDQALGGLKGVLVFFDDILVTGKNRDEHMTNLTNVLSKLQELGLKVERSKCKFFQKSVTYLGYTVDKDGIRPTEDKVKAIRDCPVPSNVSKLKSFFGIVSYYNRFTPNLSNLAKPLYNLLRKNVKFKWTKDCNIAFNKIKELIVSAPILTHFNPDYDVILSTDASDYGLGAVLAHKFPDGSEKPIAFASRTLSNAEKNYSQLDKEALAIIFGALRFNHYLIAKQFVLRTDHKPLTRIFSPEAGLPKMTASRLQRYALFLQKFNFKIEFKNSKQNIEADFLSRLPLESNVKDAPEMTYFNFVAEDAPLNFKKIKELTDRDSTLQRVIGFIKHGWPRAAPSESFHPYFSRKNELYSEHNCVMWGYRLVVPPGAQNEVLRELHSGHMGIIKMKSLARSYVWWPGLDKDLERIARECEACLQCSNSPAKADLIPWTWTKGPWQRLHLDFLGPFQGKTFIIAVDSHSKWVEVIQADGYSASKVIDHLDEMFSRFGLPFEIVTDNGPPFTSFEFKDFLNNNDIKHTTSAPFHPATNGQAENCVKQIKRVLRKAIVENQNFNKAITKFLLMYRVTPQTTTQKSPSELLFGRNIRNRLDLLRPETKNIVRNNQFKQNKYFKGKARNFVPGDKVFVKDYRGGRPKWTKADVIQKFDSRNVCVKPNNENLFWKRHFDQVLSNRQSLNGSVTENIGTGAEEPLTLGLGEGSAAVEAKRAVLEQTPLKASPPRTDTQCRYPLRNRLQKDPGN